jgi:cellulose synthase/poly-beta-1,6-N-acetylglucosamine synthase-like glycosyltransferase
MIIIDSFFWITGVLLLGVMFYLWFLAGVSLFPEKKPSCFQEPRTRFAILIPAHNEAGVISRTLVSINKLDYPAELFETVVIADNCTDETARVAGAHGVRVLERKVEDQRGKGFALQWAFESLQKKGQFNDYDAFVVVDADTVFDPGFLRVMDLRMAVGGKVIQGYYDVINPAASPMASLSYLGFALSRNLRYTGRTKLGWSGNLLGNGMCFSRDVIQRYGWRATSIVEDMEYTVILLLNGIRTAFARDALVYAEIPDTFKGSRAQRSRWDIGRFQVRNKYVGRLVKAAIRTRDVAYLDTAMELMIPPFSLFVCVCFSLFGLFLATHHSEFDVLSRLWCTVVLSLMAYVIVGLITAKAHWKTYINLLYAPFFLIWRVGTVVWGYVHKVGGKWIKTERN